MKKREPVSKIMTSNVITLNHSNSLHDAEKMFKENHIRHIPVVSGEKLVGMLSQTDLLRISFIDNFTSNEEQVDSTIYNMLTIEQVMTSNLETIDENTSIKDIAEILAEKEFHALPIVKDKKLVGIVTSTDLIKYLIDLY